MASLNSDLAARYFALFAAYEAGGRDPIAEIKVRLSEAMAEGRLRPDAALCLLILYDQMIFRPYGGRISIPAQPVEQLRLAQLPPFPHGDPRELPLKMNQSLDVIFRRLEAYERPASSHSVLKAISDSWEDLSANFGWA